MKSLLFSKLFLKWYYSHRRELPWRFNINAYNVWVAEIIFQQTRIKQGMKYYLNFIERFPDIESLANATEYEVLKMWQGLGYYSRARNLHFSAKKIMYELGGNFPSTYNEIRKLKGVGDYTAAAIASFVFNEPVAAIDGNVYRVLSRLFAVDEPIDSNAAKIVFKNIAEEIIDVENPGDFNQALIEFGALQCTPQNPNCSICPLKEKCIAFNNGNVLLYPKKSKKQKVSLRYFNYMVVDMGDSILFNKRQENDIWLNLYDFPIIETVEKMPPEIFMKSPQWQHFFNNQIFSIEKISDEIIHQLSHQKIYIRFYYIKTSKTHNMNKKQFIPVMKKNIDELPVPKVIETFLKKNLI